MEAKQEKQEISTQSLKDLAIYLSGIKDGKGNLLPLGTIVLEDLWDAIKYIEGDTMAGKMKFSPSEDTVMGDVYRFISNYGSKLHRWGLENKINETNL